MKRLLMAAALLFGGAAPVLAQFSGPEVITVPGSVTSDQATESLLGDIRSSLLPDIEQQTSWTATSVTAWGGTGEYVPMAGFIQSMNHGLWSGIDYGHFYLDFPGWVPLKGDSTTTAANLTTTVLNTYAGALASAQAQTDELGREDFSTIENASANTQSVMVELRLINESLLQIATQLQLLRQLNAAVLTVQATQAAEILNEKAREGASEQHALLGY